MKKLSDTLDICKKISEKYHVSMFKAILSFLYCEKNVLVTEEFLHLKLLQKFNIKEGFEWKDPASLNDPISNSSMKAVAKKNVNCLLEYGFIK